MNRRTLLQSLAVVPAVVQGMTRRSQAEAALRIAALEASHGGRLGVATLDIASGRRLTHRADERFPMCSTFKFLAAAYVLTRVDRGEERLDRRITFTAADLVTYSPVTETRVGQAMTVAELCDAAITLSDNTAGNLLLQSFGGPAGLTTYARSIGDMVTRLDRIEPTLNEATPGDPRDTTTAAAMVSNLQRIVLGNSLSAASRERIAEWLRANRTGDARLRAGFPKTWRIGDKTGSGAHGATNDIAVAWPPDRAPLLVAVYYAESTETADLRNAVLAEVARIVAAGSDVR
jgi:beta-lactamase class A